MFRKYGFLGVALLLLCLVPFNLHAKQPVVKLIATGGTIAMRIDPATKEPLPARSGDELVEAVPEIKKYAQIEVENPFNIASPHMSPNKWIKIHKSVTVALQRSEVAGVIVTHGTDTLEETAYFLDLTVKSSKPVVAIGAMRPGSDPDFDGPRNILNAVRICVTPEAKDKGVMVALNNQINAAREASKTHTMQAETFKSGDYGFLGYIDYDKVQFYRVPARRQHIPLTAETLASEKLPSVVIIKQCTDTGASASLLRHAVDDGVKGIVVEGVGVGHVNEPTVKAIKYAREKGVAIVVSSRVPTGRSRPQYYWFGVGSGHSVKEFGATFSDDVIPHKARIMLMLLLQDSNVTPEKIQEHFYK
jgi:L-asparaginase